MGSPGLMTGGIEGLKSPVCWGLRPWIQGSKAMELGGLWVMTREATMVGLEQLV